MEASSNVGSENNFENTVKWGVPELNSLNDICDFGYQRDIRYKFMNQVCNWVVMNPDKEHIYRFELGKDMNTSDTSAANSWIKNCIRSLDSNETMNCVVAGSYALWTLEKMFNGYVAPNWKANDIDMFLMNRIQHARHSPSGGLLDIVHTKDKTPEEVVSNFDIPCCRVAFDMNYTFYVSIHAIYSLYTKKINLPTYLKTNDSFKNILNKYHLENPPKDLDGKVIKDYHNKLVVRMSERIKKYQSRGFSFQWYETDYILPWIRQRFSYVDFDMLKLNDVQETPTTTIPRSVKNPIDIIDRDHAIQTKLYIIENLENMTKKYPEYLGSLKHHKAELEILLKMEK